MHTVAAVIDQGALTFDLAIPCEVFGLDRSDIADPWYAFRLVAAGTTPVRTQTGFAIDTPYGLEALDGADTVIVPGWSDPERPPSPELCAALRRAPRIVSLCTGAFVLAHAGLLDGRRATTHWAYADALQRRYPRALIDPDPLYVSDGHIHTSAGTTAGLDLCLALVAADHGAEVAAAVARRLVMPLHRAGGQAQYVDRPIADDPRLGTLLEWARERLADGIRVDDLASHASLSTRTLNRHFARHLGVTPGEWLASERLRLAQRLLERTDAPVALVARRAGYASPATLRAQFAARLRTSPRAYRETFASGARREPDLEGGAAARGVRRPRRVPAWPSTIPATIARPSPAPSLPRSRPPSARQKRSNSASASSVGRPGPWSRTCEPHARRSRAPTETSIGVPGGRVHERVAQQVGEHLAQLVGVAGHVGAAPRRA